MTSKFLSTIIFTLATLIACNDSKTSNHTENEQSFDATQIQDSLKAIIHIVFDNSETTNLSVALSPFLTDSSFLFISNAQRFNYYELKKSEEEYFATLQKQSFDFPFQNFKVIDKDNSIATLIGTMKSTLKNGEVQKSKIAETIIFRRINNIWKIVGGHESTSPIN